MKVFSEENFGPIIPIISFKKIDEVLQKSNDTTYGLAAYFYSKDSSKIWELIKFRLWYVWNKFWKDFYLFECFWRF